MKMVAERTPFPERLRELREAAGMTQVELAAAAGVSPSIVAYMEQGRSANPKLDTLEALADALGVSLDELTGRAAPKRRRRADEK